MDKRFYIHVLLLCLLSSPYLSYADNHDVQARQALNAGRSKSAVALLRQHIQIQPRDYQAWFLLGVAQARLEHFHPAIEAFRRVIELRPDLAEPHNNLAVIYNKLGDAKAAVSELERSLKKQPSAIVEENLADLHVKLALQFYKKALEQDENPELMQRYTRLLQVRDPSMRVKQDMMIQMKMINNHQKNMSVVSPEKKKISVNTESIGDKMLKKVKGVIAVDKGKQASEAAVLQAVEAWRYAWQAQNLDAYFKAYDAHYVPSANYANLEAWKRYKRRVIGKKAYIKLTLNDIKVLILHDGNKAKVKFKQSFRSNSYNSDTMKLLEMEKRGNLWKIVREVSF